MTEFKSYTVLLSVLLKVPSSPMLVRAMTPKRIATARAKLEEERTAMLTQKGMAQEERDRIASQLEDREKDLEVAQ